jgi:hypothetical protein
MNTTADNPTPRTTTQPINPAAVVLARFHFPTGTPWEIPMQRWHAGAFAELLRKQRDASAVPTREARPALSPEAVTARLRGPAERILELAKQCREARTSRGAAPKLGAGVLFDETRTGVNSSGEQVAALFNGLVPDLLAVTADVCAALGTSHEDAIAGDDSILAMGGLWAESARLGAVSPAADAALSEQGYTTTEFVLHLAASLIHALVERYEAANLPDPLGYAKAARTSADWAMDALETGVRHTLALPACD